MESRGTEEEDPEGEECGVESEAERKGKCRRAFQAKKIRTEKNSLRKGPGFRV